MAVIEAIKSTLEQNSLEIEIFIINNKKTKKVDWLKNKHKNLNDIESGFKLVSSLR